MDILPIGRNKEPIALMNQPNMDTVNSPSTSRKCTIFKDKFEINHISIHPLIAQCTDSLH